MIPLGLLGGIGLVLWGFSRVLLRVEPKVATVTALLVAASIVTIVAIAASQKRVTNGSLLTVVGGVFGVAMLFSGAALLVGTASGEGGVEHVSVALAAPKGAAATGFDLKTLTAPADTPFTIAFNNQDPGVQHDVVVASADPAKDPSAETFLDGEVITGPSAFDYEVPALPAAEYHYFCKIHPTTMFGVLTVAVGAQPGTGASGNVITAENLSFDRDTLSFPADTASTLTFQNNDAGVPHNVAIYPDASSSKALFTGDLVTGVDTATYDIPALPAGSYYFHCDVHPDMNGTVTVGNEEAGRPRAAHRRAGAARRPRRARRRRARERPPTECAAAERRRDGDRLGARVRSDDDLAAGRDRVDDHVRQPGRRRAAQHLDLDRRLLHRRPAVHRRPRDGRRHAGLRHPRAPGWHVRVPVRCPHHDDRHDHGRLASAALAPLFGSVYRCASHVPC